jgi:aspartyl-tRNA(Asn)/glutamyl-tRNA(Gln) amidotransferase subunit C
MAISREEVLHVAHLARLDLSPEEVERFQVQLGAVLDRAKRIQSVPVDDLPPTAHPLEIANVLRPDEAHVFEATEDILRNAPARAEALFAVPPILEEEQ